ncbi:MAG: ATP-binding domain-containing protein [Myxococcaceae bacterium]
MPGVDPERAIAEEEALLERVRTALGSAQGRRARATGPSRETLQSLREDAASAREEDAAPLLHELAVQHQLGGRAPPALPDPASPYVAHLAIREGGRRRDYLLGHATFVDAEADVWVVDWRVAPVAQLFYRYREGDPFEESFPGREASGVVEVRRVVVVHRGRLLQILGEGFQARRRPDGSWSVGGSEALAAGGAGTAPRAGHLGLGIGAEERGTRADVTALLDAEQYAAVRAPADEPLVVLGSAGSGKTTVALHRLARLAAAEPERVPLGRARVVVPEEGLARLSARLLAPLGGGAARVQTLDAAFLELARRAFGPLPRIVDDPPALVTAVKRHPALFDALRPLLGQRRGSGAPSWRRLRRDLAVPLTDRTFLDGVVARAGGSLPRTVVEETVRHTLLQLADPSSRLLASITDASRREAVDGRPVDEGTDDALAGTLDVEDLPLLLALAAWRGQLALPEASFLVIDEAEDFSLFDLRTLAGLLHGTRLVTVAGDEAQQTSPSFAGWERALETLGAGGAARVRLPVSYRCPRPIAQLARAILGPLAPAQPVRAAREGAPVGRFSFPGEPQAHLFLAGALRELLEAEPHAAVAVICHDAATARRVAAVVTEIPASRLVLDGRFNFEPGLDVTDVDSVKGLEWDYVVVPDVVESAWPMSDDGRRRLHVAVTRASWQLWLVSPGTPSRLLPSE